MSALRAEILKKESFYRFLCNYFGSSNFEVFSLAGDASTRKYFRIIYDKESYVLMAWEPFSDNNKYPFLSVLNLFASEGIHVPKALAKAPDEGFILLEDLGDLTLERRFWETANQNDIIPLYKLAIDELVKIHHKSTKSKTDSTAFHTEFDTAKLEWEMQYAKKHFLNDFLQNKLSDDESNFYDQISHDICAKLAAEPKVICHRDFHSRNIMFKLGDVYVIDFQDARLGPIQYDLVSLLKDSYVKLSDASQDILLDYYFERAKDYNFNIEENERFNQIYKYQIVQRCFKACGSFASFFNSREDQRYLKYLKPTMTTIINELEDFKELNGLKTLFDKKIINNSIFKEL